MMNNTALAPAPSQLSYNIKQAAAVLGIGRTSIYALIQDGELKPVKIRMRTLLLHDDLVALLARNRPANDQT